MFKNRWTALPLALALFILGSVCSMVCAQTDGSLVGIVADGNGAGLAGVTVQLSGIGLGVGERATVTSANGSFRFTALPAGRYYDRRVSHPGYADFLLSGVDVQPARMTRLRLTLQALSSLRERVEARARSQPVSVDTASNETRLSSEFIEALPILGRDYQSVLTLAPGVTDVDGNGNPNIHGARDTDVVTLVDGVSTTDPLTGKIGAQLNIESIQEIEIKTSGATAEFGRAQGGFANIITKSGGQRVQGDVQVLLAGVHSGRRWRRDRSARVARGYRRTRPTRPEL